MSDFSETTIAAIATPRGTGGVAIIRLSGPRSWDIAQGLSQGKKQWTPGRVCLDWIMDPLDQQVLDEVLFLPFQAPHSYTGEDCVEIHCHGGLYLSRAILNLCLIHGAEAATAGEFTRRALLSGRLDLAQAESVLDLIHAQGEALVKLSAHNLHYRSLSTLLQTYLAQIARIQADLTASIDFPEEVEEPERLPLTQQLEALSQDIHQQLDLNRRNQVFRDGVEVAIIGLPNAGKSSIFNALLASERSIVTEIAGTTRDIIRETLSLKGIPVTLVDTAGLRETADRVEILGVERSWQAIESAQAVVYVLDGSQGLTSADHQLLSKIQAAHGVILQNKADAPQFQSNLGSEPPATNWPVLQVSAQSGQGIEQLQGWLEQTVEKLPDPTEMSFLLSQRQLHHLKLVQQEVSDAAQTLSQPEIPLDLATVPLTNALLELQGLLGQDTTEMVLDSVFSRFCVGK